MNQLGFVFPGQGSQSVGMLAALAADSPQVQQTFSEASETINSNLWDLVVNGPEERLNETAITQPLMLAADIAVWRAWQARSGPQPGLLAGHSLGEYAALVASGVMQFRDAVRLVERRGQLMQSAVKPGKGAMAAILGLDDEIIEAICREAAEGQVVSAANYNSPGQLVIAGEATAVERAMHQAKAAGARRAVILPVSVPSHCALMKPAAEGLKEMLDAIELSAPEIPVLQNVSVAASDDPDTIRKALSAQLYSPVRWTDTVRSMANQGIQRIAECGPGRVLSGLGRRINRDLEWLALEDIETLERAVSAQ